MMKKGQEYLIFVAHAYPSYEVDNLVCRILCTLLHITYVPRKCYVGEFILEDIRAFDAFRIKMGLYERRRARLGGQELVGKWGVFDESSVPQ